MGPITEVSPSLSAISIEAQGLQGLVALAQAPLPAGATDVLEACILHPSSSAKPSQGMGSVRLSLAVRHSSATASGMSTGSCGPIAPTWILTHLLCFVLLVAWLSQLAASGRPFQQNG